MPDSCVTENKTIFTPCEHCGILTPPHKRTGKPRHYCSVKCSNKAAKIRQTIKTRERHKEAGKIPCQECGVLIDALNKQGNLRKWCSPECKCSGTVKYRRERRMKKYVGEKPCDNCGKSIPLYKRGRAGALKFCSKKCYREFGLIERKKIRKINFENRQQLIPCENCGKEILLLNKFAQERKFCSSKCRQNKSHLERRGIIDSSIYIFSPKDWERLKLRYNNCCCYCLEEKPLTLDHVIPIARGGRHSIGNFLPCCRNCNSSKNSKTYFEWKIYLHKKGINLAGVK